ncbi:MAG: hypothetical protein ABIZ91_18990 [Gemmatimonadaceae bacterium]
MPYIPTRPNRSSFTRQARCLLGVALVCACSGGGGESGAPTQPTPQGTLTLTAAAASTTMIVGGSASIGVTITRGGGFTGSVALSVSGLPAGVSGTFAPATLDATQTTSQLSLAATTSAAPTNATFTIAASGSGVTTQSATTQLVILQPTIALALSPATLSIAPGQSASTAIGITRSSGYAGAVTLSLEAPPSGISGVFTPSPATGATSNVVVSVSAAVPAGSYSLTVKGSAPGAVDKTTAIAVTVASALPVGFGITVDPVEMELPAGRGWGAHGIVSVQRTNGFTGPVSVSVSSLGTVAFVAPSPSTIAANQSATNLLGLALDAAPPGVYSGIVRVTAPGFAEQTAPIRLRVSLPSTGSLTWRFCNGSRVPRFFAVRDGNGSWRHIVPDGPAAPTPAAPTTFSFSLTQSTASIAMIGLGEKTSASPLIEGHNWTVYHLSTQEVVEQAAQECVLYPAVPTRTASGSVTGYTSFDAVLPSVSGKGLANVGSTGPLTTSLSLLNLQPGPFDLMLTRSSFSAGGSNPLVVQSVALRRGLDPANGGMLAPLNFATEGVPATAATVTFTNTGNESFFTAQTFMTAAGLNALFSATGTYATSSRPWFGVPATRMIAGDLHQLVATTNVPAARRAVITFAREPSSRTLAFGPSLTSPSVTPGVSATPWLVRATGNFSPDYTARASMYLREDVADPRTMTIVATRGWLGAGSTYDVAVPDLSAATGFTAFWNFRRGSPVKWTVTGGEGDPGGPNEIFCTFTGSCSVKAVDGAVYRSAQATGVVTIP